MATRPLVLAALLVGGAAAACGSSNYVYEPAQNASATVDGHPAARYGVPPEAPRGDVEVAAVGIADLQRGGDKSSRIKTMHVKLVVANNNGSGPWTVDTREQLGLMDGAGQSRPAFAVSNVGQPPLLTIMPNQKATIDLYYPLPAREQKASELPRFDVLWHVRTDAREVAERTTFDRVRIEPPPSYYDVGWNDPYMFWYDPYWTEYGFVGSVTIPPTFIVRPAAGPPPARRVR